MRRPTPEDHDHIRDLRKHDWRPGDPPQHQQMTNRYQCIGDDLRGYFVEPKYPDGRMWIVPGTYAEDPTNTETVEKAAAYRALWRVEQ